MSEKICGFFMQKESINMSEIFPRKQLELDLMHIMYACTLNKLL